MPPTTNTRRTAGTRGRPKVRQLSIAEQHAEWVRLLRPDGPFIAVPVLAGVFEQGLDTIPDLVFDRLRQAWSEVQAAPDLLNPGWCELVLRELLRYSGAALAEGAALPEDLRAWGPADPRVRPDGVAYGPDGGDGKAERLLLYRRPWDEPLTKATRDHAAAVEQAAETCRRRGTPLALLTNGPLWVLVHARTGEPTTIATFDADLWLEERELLRAFATLLGAQRVLPPPTGPDGRHSASLAALFARSADAETEVTDTLGAQVRQAVELLIGEMARLDREAGGELMSWVPPRDAYRGALTFMMRLVFLLYAEEQRLLPVDAELYAEAYSVAGLYDQLDDDRSRFGEGIGDRRAAAWPRLLATFAAVYSGCEHDELRIPQYGGALFDPERFPWLASLHVTDRVVYAILDALLVLKRRGKGVERLSYKGLNVEQIGHVYEGLLEFSCLRVDEPYVGLFGKREPELPLAEVERAFAAESDVAGWLKTTTDATATQITKGMAAEPGLEDQARLDAACDNDHDLAARARRCWGLLRTDLRGLPTVFPAGSLIITQVADRRATGTHYTPRKLAEEIVEHTLAPLCFSPGPAEGAERGVWSAKTADELLKLKVLDPAMGSGAFLVSACRYLAARVVEAWERDGIPPDVIDAVGPDFDRDDLLLEARRRVAARCLYGVDRDDMALELGKLSLWLVTLAKDKPFSFLDHALRCGDSLVGLISEEQIETFHLDPERGRYINARLSGAIDEITGPLLTRVQQLREEIEAEPIRDARHGEELARKLHEAERLADRLRLAADAVCAAALSAAGEAKSNRRPHWEEQDTDAGDLFDSRLTYLADNVEKALQVDPDGWPTPQAERADKEVRELITPMLRGSRPEPIRPLHWPLEFPEVTRHGSFDAVVSNPPFIGGKRVTGRIGEDLREYLIRWAAYDTRGNADLCAYFLLRYLSLAPHGRIGIIATNSIAQGDTREVGLDQAAHRNWDIYRAVKSQPWSGTASLEISLIWASHVSDNERRILNNRAVLGITPSLDPVSRVIGNPYRLTANADQSFQGAIVLGKGFVLEPQEALALIEKDPRNKDVLFPYLNGEDLNQRWDSSASRWVINFHNWTEERAQTYPDVFAIIEDRVKPERQRLKLDGTFQLRRPLPQRYWQYADKRPALVEAISNLDRVLVVARISRTGMAIFVPTGQVLNDKVVVFATDSFALLALIDSAVHTKWVWQYSTTLKTDLQYTPSDCFETFPMPRPSSRMDDIGTELDIFRRELMKQRQLGLTSLYDLVHDEAVQDEDIVRLREIHVEIDEAVREAYALDEEREPEIREFAAKIASAPLPSWREIDLGHGFHETRQGVRFTISPEAQLDVLDKLLALNHYRYRQEQEKGVTRKKRRRTSAKPARRSGEETSLSIEDALSPRDGTLF